MELFQEQENARLEAVAPLAARMRPRSLEEFVGQQQFLGPDKLLRRLIDADALTSAVFHGPPGTGKTTLARLIAQRSAAEFRTLHAAEAGVKDVRAVIDAAKDRLLTQQRRTVLFLDEIHRFNRAQQDSLLRDVESGVLILIGATTENPYFTINTPLLSRSYVFAFEPLSDAEVLDVLHRALRDDERGLASLHATVDVDALQLIAQHAAGDARRALTALEVAVKSQAGDRGSPHVDVSAAAESLQRRVIPHDRTGDSHYDLASALQKSMRGSDPDATLYWLARLIEGGEDPRFIARRIAVCASEDVGNADPTAAILAASAIRITETVGLPECRFALAQAAVYIACAPKSDGVSSGIDAARSDVHEQPLLPVPVHLRADERRRRADAAYQNPHRFPSGFVEQDYLGAERTYYNPPSRGREARLSEWLATRRTGRRDPEREPRSDPPTDALGD